MAAAPNPKVKEEQDLPAPQNAVRLVGHYEAERTLLDAWTSGRLPHAWLLHGPRGIGKATLAYRFARFVLAGGGDGGDLFGGAARDLSIAPQHPVFPLVARRAHPDLRVVERSHPINKDGKPGKRRGEIVVDDIRAAGDFMAHTPAMGGWRVVIVDAADEMNRNAANALLKILEEPPKRALLLLLAHNPGRLVATIPSRCRRLALRPLEPAQVEAVLSETAPEIMEPDRAMAALLSEGSAGRAAALAEGGGLALYREMGIFLGQLPRLDLPALYAFAERCGRDEDAFRLVGDLLGWWLARLVRRRARGPDETTGLAPEEALLSEEALLMDRLLACTGLDRWIEVWEKITRLFARSETVHLDRKQVVVAAFLEVERTAGA